MDSISDSKISNELNIIVIEGEEGDLKQEAVVVASVSTTDIEPKGWDAITGGYLSRVFEEFFINNLSEDIRESALSLLCSLWVAGTHEQKLQFISQIEQKSATLLSHGKNSLEFFKLFSFLCTQLSKDPAAKQAYSDRIRSLFRALLSSFQSGLNELVSHPDHGLYQFLEDIVDDYGTFKPQYLELNGCLNCFGVSQQNAAKEEKLSTLMTEMRTGTNRLIIKLKKTMEIEQIALQREPAYVKSKRNFVKQINVFVNNNLSSDMNALKQDLTLWRKVKTTNVEKEVGKEYLLAFPVPITAKFLCLEFAITAKLSPQCARCPEVRSEGSGFYCTQCHYSPIVQLDSTLVKFKQSSTSDAILIDSDKSKENCETSIAEYTQSITDIQRDLAKEKQKMRVLYDRYHGTKCNSSVGILLNSADLEAMYNEMMNGMNSLMSHRKALAEYCGFPESKLRESMQLESSSSSSSSSNLLHLLLNVGQHNCYGCLQSFLAIFLEKINSKESLGLLQEIASEEDLQSFQNDLFAVYSPPPLAAPANKRRIPAKIASKAMKIHKNVLLNACANKGVAFIKENLIEPLRSQLLLVAPHPESTNLLQQRIVDLRILLETARERLKSTTDEHEAKNLSSLTAVVFEMVNAVLQHLLCGTTSINPQLSNEVQNNIVVPLLEIMLSEFNAAIPNILSHHRDSTSCATCSELDQIFISDQHGLLSSSFESEGEVLPIKTKPKNRDSAGSSVPVQQGKAPSSYTQYRLAQQNVLASQQAQAASGKFNSSLTTATASSTSVAPPRRPYDAREQIMNSISQTSFNGGQLPGGFERGGPGVGGGVWQGRPTAAAGQSFGQYLSYSQPLNISSSSIQQAAAAAAAWPPKRLQPQDVFSTSTTSSLPYFIQTLSQAQGIGMSPQPYSNNATHPSMLMQPQSASLQQQPPKPESWRKKKGVVATPQKQSHQLGGYRTEEEKLNDLLALIIGEPSSSVAGTSEYAEVSRPVSMEIERVSGEATESLSVTSATALSAQVVSTAYRSTRTRCSISFNWLKAAVIMFESQRVQELIHYLIVAIACVSPRVASQILLQALPAALQNQGMSMGYFEVFSEVILLFNVKTDSRLNLRGAASNYGVSRGLPGLQMVHQQSSEDMSLSRTNLMEEEEDESEASEFLDILSAMFANLDGQLKIYAGQKNKQIVSTKDFLLQNLSSGAALNSLTSLLKSLVENHVIKAAFKKRNATFMQQIISSVVSIRKFKYILNHHFHSIEALLSLLFQELQSNTLEEKHAFLSQLVTALPMTSKDPLGQEFLMEQVIKILIPKKIIPYLRLEVQSNQREYLPSSLPKKDISAAEFGTTMNDVLQRIKSELPDASWVIEMLIANKLINNKELPIDLVYKKVWIPHSLKIQASNIAQLATVDLKKQIASNPMRIVYRITGFDGEAQEELVDSIVDEEQTNCLSLSRVLFQSLRDENNQETFGLTTLLDIIKNIYEDPEQKFKLASIITILSIACKHPEGKKIALQFNGVATLVRVLMKQLPTMNENEPEQLIQNIFELIHGLLDESENSKLKIYEARMMQDECEEEQCLKDVTVCIEKMTKIDEKASSSAMYKARNGQLVQDLIRLLPIVTRDYLKPSQFLVNNFADAIQFEEERKPQPVSLFIHDDLRRCIDIKKENQEKVSKYIEIAERIPEDFQSFREESVNQGILEKAVHAFISVIPAHNEIDQTKAKVQKNCLKRCLSVFMGLMKGNAHVQLILNDAGILHSIFQLADPSIKIEEIGKLAEVLIEYLVNEKNNVEKSVQANILKITQSETQRKRERADQVKQTQLTMLTTNAQKIFANFNFSDIEEEQSIKCVVCQEGYTLRPEEVLGAYIFSANSIIADEKRLLLAEPSLPVYAEKQSSSSVTSFNCIHLKCHNDAVQADANSKKPKGEWEGALIRNFESKCNNWIPLKGPETDDASMKTALKKYLKGTTAAIQNGHSAPWIIINDFKGLLMKFATQEEIAKETRTTFETNLKVFPFMISAASFLLSQDDHKEMLDRMSASLTKLLEVGEQKEEQRKLELLQTFAVMQLFVVTPEAWKEKVQVGLLRLILKTLVTQYFKPNVDLDSRVVKYGSTTLILFALVSAIVDHIHAKALSGHQGSLTILQQKLDAYISNSYDLVREGLINLWPQPFIYLLPKLIDQFTNLHGEFRDKITKFTKVSEFLDFCGARQAFITSANNETDVNVALAGLRG